MSTKNTNRPDFRFFVPLDINKGKSKGGEDEMLIEGIASTSDEDSDGEFLDPNGYELDYFKNFGVFNWQHRAKSDPMSIVGTPTSAVIKDGKFYVKGKLFNNNPIAKGIYSLAKDMEGTGRKIGFSIEGKALERDVMNPKIVKRAKITGIAITPTPKNANTFMDICKGEYSMDEPEYYGEDVPVDTNQANGGSSTYLIDITTPEGHRVVVTKSLETKIIAKSLNTESGAALKNESLEGGKPKNTDGTSKKNEKYLTKSEVYDEIFSTFPKSDLDIAKSFYNFIEEVQEKIDNKMKNITPEAVKAAKELLKAATEDTDLEKGQGNSKDFPTDNPNGPANMGASSPANGASQSDFDKVTGIMKGCYKDDVEKAEIIKAVKAKAEEEGVEASDEDVEKAYSNCKDVKKSDEDGSGDESEVEKENDKDMADKENEVSKSEEAELLKSEAASLLAKAEELEKAEATPAAEPAKEDLSKSEGSDNNALVELIKGQGEEINKKFEALGTLHAKQSEDFELLKSQNDELSKRLEDLEGQPVRKSVPSTQGYLEKGSADGDLGSEGQRITLSASKNKNVILKAVDNNIDLEKAEDGLLNDIQRFEGCPAGSGYMPNQIAVELKKVGIDIVE